jgi:L-alanine-DL-glutamate epimerase-like enolase superfamily enzyme
MDQHLGYKEKHQDHVADLKAAGRPVGEKCRAWIELDYLKNDTHLLFEHRRHPDRRSENSRIYSAVAERVRTMAKAIGREVPVIIDADGLAPARHVFEFARELGKRGLQSIEFAGHPRLR